MGVYSWCLVQSQRQVDNLKKSLLLLDGTSALSIDGHVTSSLSIHMKECIHHCLCENILKRVKLLWIVNL